MLDLDNTDEIIFDDPDAPMDSDDDEGNGAPLGEIQLVNKSVAHFDTHKDSIFSVPQHLKSKEP